jgi:hypothetical protein
MNRNNEFLKKISLSIAIGLLTLPGVLKATPSTQIWIPSTDIQGFKTLHLGIDNYIRTQTVDGVRGGSMYDLGLTAGVLPFNKLQAEVGADFMSLSDNVYDNYPVYFNLKVALPEDSLFKGCPALAIGAYNFGTKKNLTNYNIVYALIAKNIPYVGRLSAGYYYGNDKVLLDDKGNKAAGGLLLSWDRSMTEISDKLWLAVDYQGGMNYLGALSFGFSWSFSKNVSVIFGYDIYNNKNALYNSVNTNAQTFTSQLDINF